jgi:low affinity Fe/Cu permease
MVPARDRAGASAPKARGTMETSSRIFTEFAARVAHIVGRPLAFAVSVLIVLGWAVTGPIFDFSDTWQLIINTGTTIVTFLMVFLIQNTQNRDGAAIQAKLDELIRTSAAQDGFIGIEHLTEEELDEIRRKCEQRARSAAGGAAETADTAGGRREKAGAR